MISPSWTLCTLLFLLSWGSSRERAEVLEPQSARTLNVQVMSFNILNAEKAVEGVRRWRNRSLTVANIIGDNSEIAGLQEVLQEQMDAIQTNLGSGWGHIGVGRDDGVAEGESCPIFYFKRRLDVDEHGTFWFSDRPDVPGSRPGAEWGSPVQRRICTWGRFVERDTGKGFYVYNVHLSHNRGAANPLLYRRKSVMLLQKRVRNRNRQDEPFIITGDFNARPTTEAIAFMLGRANFRESDSLEIKPSRRVGANSQNLEPLISCRDAWAFLHPGSLNQRTFHGGRGEHGKGWRLDYIFVQSAVDVIESEILRFSEAGYFPSDHYPIVASLSLRYSE